MNKNLTYKFKREILSTLTSKGQVTIPAEIRHHLKLQTKDKIAFVIENQKEVKLKPVKFTTVASLKGAAGKLKKPLNWKEVLTIGREDALNRK